MFLKQAVTTAVATASVIKPQRDVQQLSVNCGRGVMWRRIHMITSDSCRAATFFCDKVQVMNAFRIMAEPNYKDPKIGQFGRQQ